MCVWDFRKALSNVKISVKRRLQTAQDRNRPFSKFILRRISGAVPNCFAIHHRVNVIFQSRNESVKCRICRPQIAPVLTLAHLQMYVALVCMFATSFAKSPCHMQVTWFLSWVWERSQSRQHTVWDLPDVLMPLVGRSYLPWEPLIEKMVKLTTTVTSGHHQHNHSYHAGRILTWLSLSSFMIVVGMIAISN